MVHPDLIHFVRLLPEPTFLVGGDGVVLLANDAAGELTGRRGPAVEGADLSAVIADPPEKVREYLRLCARSRQLVPGSFVWRAEDGRTLEVRCDGTVLRPRSADGPATLFLRCRPKGEATDQFVLLNQKIAALTAEVLERKKAEMLRDESLRGERAARVEAERNSRMKDEFLATLSHELRTPLNAILGWAHLLRNDLPPGSGGAEGLEVIERNARLQTQLIDDLLDMSRIISGKVRLDVQRVDLAAAVEQAVRVVRPAADAKSVRLQLTLDPLAGPVNGDPGRLQQVLWNLLSNAVKFTPKGGRVQVSLERVNSHLEVTVSDTGEGIRPEFLPHVFDRFRQADASTTRRHGGLGLGLSIVKQLVELHGGSVLAKSRGPQQGATFVVMLPLAVLLDEDGPSEGGAEGGRVHPAGRVSGSPPHATPGLSGLTVLVVDDEPDARELVRRVLERSDARVATAGSARQALERVAEEPPDVLVSDIGMPEVDGYELIRRVRAMPPDRGGRVPAIALTAFARTEDRTRAMLAGYNIHLSKPTDPVELVATVASLAGRTGRPA